MEALENLVKINKLQKEPFDQAEFDGMLNAAKNRLNDAGLDGLSKDSRFLLSYGAAHILSLAALRWYGYRSDSRYLVFQCLQHTVDFSTAQWRILDDCHRKRNLAEYEGNLDICNALLKELLEISEQLYEIVKNLGEKS
ncbi:MAG: hypothetical protein KDI76_04205 [Xanthomonadales bacterium]|nr:hypothetical protein [Xanthomonadales bacterium]